MSRTINAAVWGNPASWQNPGSLSSDTGIKIPGFAAYNNFASGSLGAGFIGANVDLFDLDDTISPWGIGRGADFLKGQIWLIDPDGTNSITPSHLKPYLQQFSFEDVAHRPAFSFVFGYNTSDNYRYFHKAWEALETIDQAADPSSWYSVGYAGASGSNYGTCPIVRFNYNNVLVVPVFVVLTSKTKAQVDSLFSNNHYAWPTTGQIDWVTTDYSISEITDEILNNYYVIGMYFRMYGLDSRPGQPNEYAYYRFGILEKEAFPALDTVTGGIFGNDHHIPYSVFAESSDNNQYGAICGSVFTPQVVSSGNDTIYSAGEYANGGFRSSAYYPQYQPQPKVFGGSSTKWSYYGYISRTGNEYQNFGRVCYPIFTWNGGNAAALQAYAKQQAAFLGFIFSDSKSSSVTNKKTGWNGSGNNEYLPIFDENGYTTGQFAQGAAAAEQPNATWGVEVWEKTEYKGTPPGDPNEYDTKNQTELNTQYGQMMMRFCKGYLLTKAEVDALAVKCYDIGHDLGSAPDIVQEMLTKLFLKDGDPMDIIISLMFFPFNPAKYLITPPSQEEIFFGAFPTGITAKRWDNLIVEIDLGSCTFYPTMGDSIDDFRNYQPYTTAELQLPYIGSVDIDPHIYLGHKISVKYVVDLCTGSCQALIYRDSLVVDQLSGHIGSAVSVKGVDQLEQLTAQQRAQANLKQARNTQISNIARMGITAAAAVGSVLTGGTLGVALGAGAIGGASNLIHSQNSTEQAEYEVDHIQTPYREIGHASSITAYRGEQFCRLIIKRPRMDASFSAERYAHSIGYATLSTAALSQFSGYTVCSSADLSGITATDQELNAIAAALRAGVYL